MDHEVACYSTHDAWTNHHHAHAGKISVLRQRSALRELRRTGKITLVTVSPALHTGHIVGLHDEGREGIPGHVLVIQTEVEQRSKDHSEKLQDLFWMIHTIADTAGLCSDLTFVSRARGRCCDFSCA